MKKGLMATFISVGIAIGTMGTASASFDANLGTSSTFEECDRELTICLFVLGRPKPYCFQQFRTCMSQP